MLCFPSSTISQHSPTYLQRFWRFNREVTELNLISSSSSYLEHCLWSIQRCHRSGSVDGSFVSKLVITRCLGQPATAHNFIWEQEGIYWMPAHLGKKRRKTFHKWFFPPYFLQVNVFRWFCRTSCFEFCIRNCSLCIRFMLGENFLCLPFVLR